MCSVRWRPLDAPAFPSPLCRGFRILPEARRIYGDAAPSGENRQTTSHSYSIRPMAETPISDGMLKEALKNALEEVLQERRDLFRDLVADVLMDMDGVEDPLQREAGDDLRSVFSMTEGEA